MPNDNELEEQTLLEQWQNKMLENTEAVAFVNSLFPDQMDTGEAIENMEKERRESES